MIITDDIFMKAALRYCERRGIDPLEQVGEGWILRQDVLRTEMEKLCEKILSLYEVGALPR